MPVTTELSFRPTETHIYESQHTPPLYRIETHVKFFFDKQMTKLALEKDMVFENVEFPEHWELPMAQIYGLINSSL